MPTHCTHCGAALPPGSAFCPACGQPVAPDPAQAAPPAGPPISPPVAPQYGAPPQAPYGQPPPQAPYGQPPPPQAPYGQPQPPYGQAPPGQQMPGQFPPAVGQLLQNAPAMGQRLQSLPFLASLPLGMRLPALGVAALLALLLLSKIFSHGGPNTPGGGGGGNTPSAQAGVFSGACTTEAGKPLANVDVRIAGVTSAGENTVTEVHTDANGVYSQTLPPGKYSVFNALYPVTVGGTNYALPLAIPDGANNDDADIGPGVVRNLVLHIHGKIAPSMQDAAWQSYYGGNVLFYVFGRYQIGGFPAGSITELTLVPEGPLADGSTGQTVTLREASQVTNEGCIGAFNDIPIGQYTMTVRLLNPDGSPLEPLTINSIGAAGNDPSGYKPSIPGLVFPPDTATAQYAIGTVTGVSVLQMSLNDGG